MYASPASPCSRFRSHSHHHHHHRRLAYSPSSFSKTNSTTLIIRRRRRPPSPSCNYSNNGFFPSSSSSNSKKPLISPSPPKILFVSNSTSSSSDSSDLPSIDDGDEYEHLESGISSGISVDEGDDESGGGEFEIQVEKLEKNTRRIRAQVGIHANLETVWNLLTDYEHLPDFIPGLAVSKLLDKTHNYAKIYQVGEQNLAFGLKFNAKGIVDCYEKDLEGTPFGHRRDIDFKMSEGNFQIFEGKWSIEEKNNENQEGSQSFEQEFQTTLFYVVDVKPKLWLPVRLVEGRLCREIKVNLLCIREQAQKEFYNKLSSC